MPRSTLVLFTLALATQAGIAGLLTTAQAQSKVASDADAAACESFSNFNTSNDFQPCNRFVAHPGFSPLGRAIALDMRARGYIIRGHFDLAIRDYTTVLSLLEKHPTGDDRAVLTRVSRARVHEVKGDFQSAEKDYREALRIDPSNYMAPRFLKALEERRAGKTLNKVFENKLLDKMDLDREDIQRFLTNNTIFAATARDADPWRAYFGADGSMAIVYANGKRRNGRWALDAGKAVCVTLEGAAQECRRVTKVILYAHRSATYYLWIDAKSGQTGSHIYEARPGKFIDRTGLMIDREHGRRAGAGLRESLQICKLAGLAAVPHLRTHALDQKRPRFAHMLRLNEDYPTSPIHDLTHELSRSRPKTPVGNKQLHFMSFDKVRREGNYEKMFLYPHT